MRLPVFLRCDRAPRSGTVWPLPDPPLTARALVVGHGPAGAPLKPRLQRVNGPARRNFRVLTRTRNGYSGSTMYDVQLQDASSGALVWAQTFTDQQQATEYEQTLDRDLDELDDGDFRRKYGVPSAR